LEELRLSEKTLSVISEKRLCSENDLKLFYVFPETDTIKFSTELKENVKALNTR
jgi:hypothetical protein